MLLLWKEEIRQGKENLKCLVSFSFFFCGIFLWLAGENKMLGSFHSYAWNTVWRRQLLEGILHPACIDPPDAYCNVCGLTFTPTPDFFIPGNMWTAGCDYINRLVPPMDYEPKRVQLASQFDQLRDEKKLLDIRLFKNGEFEKGVARFASGTFGILAYICVYICICICV